MTSIRVTHHIDDLASDLKKITVEAPTVIMRTLREEARLGNEFAKGFARQSSGSHGKWYPGTFSVGAVSKFSGFGGGNFTVEYGPVAGKRQGGMSFEFGSRNQPPHLDLAKSADIVGPRFGGAVLNNVDSLFWPGA